MSITPPQLLIHSKECFPPFPFATGGIRLIPARREISALGERVARRGVFISRGETGEGVSPMVKSNMGHHTNGASPQPDDACLWPLLRCKNLTHLHQIFGFKISRRAGKGLQNQAIFSIS